MSRLSQYWPFSASKTRYAVLMIIEISSVAFVWWHFIWDFGYKPFFFAATVLLALTLIQVNKAIVSWFKKPKKKESEKKPDPKKTSSIRRLR